MELTTPLTSLAGVGPTLSFRLKNLNLKTVEDLITYYPFRYDDFSNISSITSVKTGDKVTLKGEIWSISNTYTRFRKVITKAVFNDGTGPIEIIWFNQPWLTKNISSSDQLQISGKVKKTASKTQIISPQWEKIKNSDRFLNTAIHTGRLVPVYPETFGLTSKWLRQRIAQLLPLTLPQMQDSIPTEFTKDNLSLIQAISQIHFPDDYEMAKKAYQRLAFDELYLIQLSTLKQRATWQHKQTTKPFNIDHEMLATFIKNLPFELTNAQKRVIDEISSDLIKGIPMNRLLQGEVGSGKTVVAAAIAYLSFLNGQKTVLMAPTEILAFQHFQTLNKFLSVYNLSLGLYTGSKKFTKTQNSLPDIIIGTHALLSDKLKLENIGLVIIDEQQRFGVEQRTLLRNKTKVPHFLTMTATPIPRTVALTLYGDLDMSVIDELPKNRKVVRTYYVPGLKRDASYKFIEIHIKQGFQAYIITPLIEQSETLISAKAAKFEYQRLQKDIYPDLKLGLLHGRLKAKDKEAVINQFKSREIDILVSTSVVEVGMDIPNATMMVIEGADRFGLAQLHQLRGRVGRGSEQSYALLFCENNNPQLVRRVRYLETIHDGLKLSELDLELRGSGQIYGKLQSGSWDLKIASLNDLKLVEQSRQAAEKTLLISPDLDKYPELRAKLTKILVEVMPD